LPQFNNLPIIAVTAKAMKGDREKCIEAGAWGYLSQPVDTEQLLSVLRVWLHRENCGLPAGSRGPLLFFPALLISPSPNGRTRMAIDVMVDILVVDDLPEKLLVYQTVLESLGQNVIAARSGREALRHLLEREFALILLDVHMPDMDGFETAAMLRSRRQTAHTPIIFITAFSDEMNTAHGYSLGAVDYILAPIVPEILRTKVGVFVDLYKKTQLVKRQAEERIALERAQAARDAAELANRRSSFLADASTVLVRSLDHEAIARELARQSIPFLGELCAVTLSGRHGSRTELAWIDPARGLQNQTVATRDLRQSGLLELIERVVKTEEASLFQDLTPPRE